MSALGSVLRNDARNVFRDRTIGALLVVPVVFVVLFRFGFPMLLHYVPAAAGYGQLALGMFCGIAATFPAFMMAFLMLDERDLQVTSVLATLPVRVSHIVWCRAGAVGVFGAFACAVLLFGSGLSSWSAPQAAVFVLLCGLIPPTSLLIVLALADNKIEGLTVFKVLFFLLFLAAAVQAWDSPWSYVMGAFPPFWTYRAFTSPDGPDFWLFVLVSLATHLVVLFLAHGRVSNRRRWWS